MLHYIPFHPTSQIKTMSWKRIRVDLPLSFHKQNEKGREILIHTGKAETE